MGNLFEPNVGNLKLLWCYAESQDTETPVHTV